MKTKVLYIERKPYENVSIEKVFRQISKSLDREKFEVLFQTLPYLNDTLGTLKNLLFFRKRNADIYHITGHNHYIALLFPKRTTVLTIHDTGILRIRKGWRRYLIKKINFELPLKKLKYITTISEATKRDLIALFKCPPEKIRVIENPLQEYLRQLEFSTETDKKNFKCPTILQIGTAQNKNLYNLFSALENIECRLVIVGKLDAALKEFLKLKRINYENKFNLSDEEIRDEYLKTDIVTFCSTFEGFGLPIIEAQAMLKPVITSNISPLKEVAGNAALLVDPHDIISIREGFLKMISDEKYRQELIVKGFVNVKRFDAAAVAALYESIYSEIIEDTASPTNF